ncbi:hypothetical protein CASFOL_004180 [Castilleja foliolosa]|uniref:Uncharacterized protein n=1 Tax=Castilleja foliolosa TaxID=1961234 RepID=A0ABD3EN48_9LAMI
MSSSLCFFHIPKALPSLSRPHQCKLHNLFSISCQHKQSHQHNNTNSKKQGIKSNKILGLAVQAGGALAIVAAQPALAVTGDNEEIDLVWTLIQLGISAFLYFIVAPPTIMNWLRTRWYKRNLLEIVLLWAPFLNFRKFPRDPSMKYPWSTPENPSQIKGGYLKYPWAQPEDYE